MCPIYESERRIIVDIVDSPSVADSEEFILPRDRACVSASSLPLHFPDLGTKGSPVNKWRKERGLSLDKGILEWTGDLKEGGKDNVIVMIPYRHSTGSLPLDFTKTQAGPSKLKNVEYKNTGASRSARQRSPLQTQTNLQSPLESFQRTYEKMLLGCANPTEFLKTRSFIDRFTIDDVSELRLDQDICILRPYPHLISRGSDSTRYLNQLENVLRSKIHIKSRVLSDLDEDIYKETSGLSNNGLTDHPYHIHRLCFHPGAIFTGKQKSTKRNYDVTVTLLHISLQESFAGGYLNIRGLTSEYPSLTTYFEAEIIGPHHGFITKKWDTDPEIDLRHWELFNAFDHYKAPFLSGKHIALNPLTSRYIFMRWKEQFLVPDHHVTRINGASYDGFYYVCLDLKDKTIHGYYYYRCANEWFEELSLTYNEATTMGAYQLS